MSERPDGIGACPIEREIGRGAMEIVYLARDEGLDRAAAIVKSPEEEDQTPFDLALNWGQGLLRRVSTK